MSGLQSRLARGAALTILAIIAGCDLPKLGQPSLTPYERYARGLTANGLDSTAIGRDWLLASDSAMRAPLRATLPMREAGFYSRAEARAVAFRLSLTDGQRLDVSVQQEGQPARLFVDLFEQPNDTIPRFEHRAGATTDSVGAGGLLRIAYEVRSTGTYLLRIQPELLRDGRYQVAASIGPQLAFPVDGQGNRAVQSFFGAARDAGRREHHGIDIFAPRGTPALAATDGLVRSTSPNNLGGNVVWLSDVRRGQTMYYAHLDSQVVSPGQSVRVGDTLGFVGNTGNARTTKPHLHFAIYRRSYGPVDPYPFIRIVSARAPVIAADTSRLGYVAALTTPRTVLRRAPNGSADSVGALARATRVYVMGAQGRWFRVQLTDGRNGYVAMGSVGPSLSRTMRYGLTGVADGTSSLRVPSSATLRPVAP
ncbi:MAG: M23 family metallopeptidase [Gemmatimonadaceae bacterium]